MSTPTDLRHTLAAHAGDVTDRPAVDRLAAVHGRVRVVRRRRRAAGAVAALTAVVGVGVVAGLPGGDGPGPAQRPTVAGVTAPGTMTSLGYGYAFDSAVTGDGSATLRLPAADQPRLVSWAGSAGRLRLRSDVDLDGDGSGPDTTTPAADGFSDFVYVPADLAQTLRVTDGGEVALAVYTLATRAPGVTEHGVTWRDEVAGGRRLAADTGEQGVTSLTTDLVVPASGSVSAYALCAGAPAGTQVSMTLADGSYTWGGCGEGPPAWDAIEASGGGTALQADTLGAPGSTVPVRLDLIRVKGDDAVPVTDAPDVRLGLGLYLDPPSRGRVGTSEVPGEIEEGGRLWSMKEVLTSRPGRRTLTASLEADATPVLVQTVTDHTRSGYTRTLIGGRVVATSGNATDGGGSRQTVVRLVDQAVSAEVRVGSAAPDTVLGLAVYDQAG